MIIDEVRQILDLIAKEPDAAKRSQLTSAAIVQGIGLTVYFIMLGSVIIVLGRRIINATLKAWKESRREPS